MNKLIKIHLSLLLLLCTCFGAQLIAQEVIPDYDWEVDRKYAADITDESSSLILLKNHNQRDYRYDGQNLVTYNTVHKIYRVNNDEALQSVNRIYIPLGGTIEIVKIRARTITKSGKVIELDEQNIKQVKDEEDGAGYSIFAIEGGEVGSDIEYFYTKKNNASYFGREFFQFSHPAIQSSFRLTSPKNLKFDFKSYNDLAEIEETDTNETFNIYDVNDQNTPLLTEETFSSYDASKKRLEYKLAYNTAGGKQRLFTWSDAGKRIFELIYPFVDVERKAVKDLLKELKAKKIGDPLKQYAFIEHHIKSNFYIDEQADESAARLDNAIKNRFSNKKGFARLLIGVLNELGIENEIVMTSSRSEIPFDGDFDSWNYLGEYLLYLPSSGQFIAPSHFETRIGYWPPEFSSVEGLHIKKMSFEGNTIPVGQIKKIPALSYAENFDNLNIQVTFNKDLSENEIIAQRTFRGFNGNFVKLNFMFSNDEQKSELAKSLIEFLGPGSEINKAEIKDAKTSYDQWSDPVTIDGQFTSSEFIEQAGDILLFKVGELIGVQSELYQENARTTNVENDYNRGYLRQIEVDIPEGYTIQNPDDLIMDVKVSEKDEAVFLFKSSYTIEGNKLVISIDEYYDQIDFPIERFEEFRKVINAAADWNKITLVLEPK